MEFSLAFCRHNGGSKARLPLDDAMRVHMRRAAPMDVGLGGLFFSMFDRNYRSCFKCEIVEL